MSPTDPQILEAARKPSNATLVALLILVVLALAPFMHYFGGQQVSRYALTTAVWDHGTLEVTEYADLLFRDGAARDGAFYSDKAPGQPLLAVPFYGAYRLAGGDPLPTDVTRDDLIAAGPNFGLWWLTAWSAAVPAALLAVLMYRWASEFEPGTALAATLTMTFGTLLVVYSTLLFGHVLAALFALGMFLLVRRSEATAVRLLVAGALGGLAVTTEYPLVLVVAIITGAAFFVHRSRAWPVLAGGAPFGLLLGLYNWLLFGSPFVLSYQWNAFSGVREEAAGTLEIFAGPSLERVVGVLFSERGLLIATPVTALAVVGIVVMWRQRWRVDAVVVTLSFLSMLAIQFMWGNSFAGGAGPRYAIPGLPFLAAPLALAWRRWQLPTTALAFIGVLTLVAATVTVPQLGSEMGAGMADWLRTLFAGRVAPTVYTEAVGPWGWAIHLTTVGLALTYLLMSSSSAKMRSLVDSPPMGGSSARDENVQM